MAMDSGKKQQRPNILDKRQSGKENRHKFINYLRNINM